MTYQEIKDRLSKCELTLEKLKNGTKPNTPEVRKEINKLTVLKESYQRHLLEADKGMVYTDDEDKAKELADDGANVKLTVKERLKENEGVKFSVEETKAIAKKVGKALALSLRNLGDQVHSMKAHHIEENSFEVEINFKGTGPNDEFSFYIVDDTLHLVDFSFDKELVDVGVKPSGEAIVHVEHLANELTKHFKSLNEDEEEDAKNDADYEAGWTDDPRMDEAAYTQPKHFDICPGAETLRNKLIDGGKSPEELSDWTRLHDDLFKLEKAVIKVNKADDKHVEAASKLREKIIHISRDLGIEAEDITYLKSHVEKIKDIADGKSLNEAPDNMYYIKVKKTDKASLNGLQDVIETWYSPVKFADIVDDDGAGNVVFYLKKSDWDPGMEDDIVGNGVQIYDTNMPLSEGEKETDDYGRPHVPEKGSSTYVDPKDMTTSARAEKMLNKEDKDIGHQDDEPDMLQATAYEVASYAAKLVKKLQKYDNFDGEVDFPNWWQAKLILAKDYMQKAYHYLDSEEKQPAIDQLALENKPPKPSRIYDKKASRTYDQINGSIIQDLVYMKEYVEKEGDEEAMRHFKRADMAYMDFDEYMTYDDTARRTREPGRLEEAMSSEQKEAIYDLENILDQAAQLGDEARDIIKQHFPNELSAGDAYDVFNFGSSSNSYDKTLETLISDIQRTAEEEDFDDDDLDEGIGKIQKAHSQLIKQMKDLAARYKAGDKEVIKQLKDLTAKKKRLEKELDKAVSNTGRNQQLAENEIRDAEDDPGTAAYRKIRDEIQKHARRLNDDDAYTMHELLKDFFNRLMEMNKSKEPLNEEATCCGRCGRVHVKGSGCKRPYLKGKSHCRNK